MTAVSTLDQIDWATCLDQEPGCENSDGCDRPATHRLIWTCRCPAALACWPCAAYEIGENAKCLTWPNGVWCTECGLVQHPAVVEDLIRAELL